MWIAVAVLGLLFHQAPSAGPGRDRALFDAARLGDTARIRELLAAGADVTLTDARGFTALMWACAAASPEAVQLLLDAGAPASHAAGDGTTALLLAASNGLEDSVRRLLARGPDVFAAKAGVTPRQAAASRGHTAIAARLEAAEDLGRRLLQAAADGQPEVVRQVVALGAPVNARNEQGASALMFVARHGDVALMQFLLARGADPRARDADGASVYDWAARSSSTVTYVTEFLRDRGVAAETPTARAASEAPPVSSSLRALQASLARIAPESDPQRAAHRRAGAALARLQELAAQWPADSPDDYRASLADHGRTLDAADRGRLADTLQALAEDLEVKLEHCLASGGRLGGSVTVRVRTVQNARETGSWQVFYMPKVFEASATASPDLFPQLSSPTEETLVPGRYLMWLRNPATGIVGERTVVKVGEGRQELVVDLAVPGGGSQ
jgi:hypothetical protein